FDATPVPYPTSIKGQVYSGTADWTPQPQWSFSGGYTYNHLTTNTAIRVPVGGVFTAGTSQFFIRDSYINFDVSAHPVKGVSLYAAYRIDFDRGQGNLFSTTVFNLLTSYPMQFLTPEVRVAFKLTKNVDWNVGYQYYNFHDSQTPNQNYRAHLPYTSLRIY